MLKTAILQCLVVVIDLTAYDDFIVVRKRNEYERIVGHAELSFQHLADLSESDGGRKVFGLSVLFGKDKEID